MDKIVGISAGFHDAAAACVEGGIIKFAGHAERYSRVKNDKDLNQLLIEAAIPSLEPDVVAYYESPIKKWLRMLYAGQKPVYNSPKKLTDEYWYMEPEYRNFEHHKSHVAAGFQTSYFTSAVGVVVDAIGEWDTASIWYCSINPYSGAAEYKKLWSTKYPHSLGIFYSAVTQRCGLKPNEDEYILMGMAAYGDPTHNYELRTNLFVESETLQLSHNLHTGLPTDLLPEADFFDLASSAQAVLEDKLRDIFALARKYADKYQTNNLVYMGGVALNCSANSKVIDQSWSQVWIMPNPGDAGSALGAAALAYGCQLEWNGPFLGTAIGDRYPVGEALTELLKNKIAGVAAGRAEFGPRAFGNRSLLADPRDPLIKDRVNEIKKRQKFRPFAPVILAEHADQYFDMSNMSNKNTEYMQFTVPCLDPGQFPGIVHADSTSRIQTVPKNSSAGIRQLLEAWYQQTNCPMLLNTSLNIKGQPLVDSLEDARAWSNTYQVPVFTGY
jgi:carbamoyltransferase